MMHAAARSPRLAPCLAAAGLALACTAIPARAQNLVRDIVAPSSGAPNGSPQDIVDLNGVAIFVATTGHGREPWRSDGTSVGTYPLKDINPGPASSNPGDLTVAGNVVFFKATVPGLGTELWRTDGTAAGTFLLRDGLVGNGSGAPATITAFGPHVYFAANDGANGLELWRSDGTVAGTAMFVDVTPGAAGSFLANFTVAAGRLFFTAITPGLGRELWSTDGTVAGTALVAEIHPGPTGTSFGLMAGATNGLFFVASTAATGAELHFSDGTAAGTLLLRDIRPGSSPSFISELRPFGAGALLRADDGQGGGGEPWYSDGTPAGTVPLGDLQPGPTSSSPTGFTSVSPSLAVFSALGASVGNELWVTDGTAAGTFPIDVNPGTNGSVPQSFAAGGGGVFFVATETATGRELWFTDGSAAGTALVADIRPGNQSSNPSELAWVGARLMFAANNGTGAGNELHRSDGTAAGTSLVADVYLPQGDSNPEGFLPTPNGIVFGAGSSTTRELWSSDGTVAGTIELDFDPFASNPGELTLVGSTVFAAGNLQTVGRELIATDGTLAGTGLALDLRAGGNSSSPAALASAFGQLWFRASADPSESSEPFVSDGTAAGTVSLGDLRPGNSGSNAGPFVPVGGVVVFPANDGTHGTELWVSDGTAAGTALLLDINPGAQTAQPLHLVSFGSVAYFVATQSGGAGRELWRTDGTTAGTTLVADLQPGFGSSNPEQIVQLANGTVLFVAGVSVLGQRLHRTDGTAAGTAALGQIGATTNPQIEDLVAVGSVAFFTANDMVHGRELWMTDGVTVSMVADVYPGAPSGVIEGTLAARAGQNQVVFAGADGNDGLQIWLSDGTAAGTTQVGKVGPWAGVGAVELADFTEVGADVWFVCDEGITGREPWVISLSGPVAATSTYGAGCPGTGGLTPQIGAVGLPTIGNQTFAVSVANGVPASVAIATAGFAPTSLPIAGCTVLVAPPWYPLPTVFLDGAGAGSALLPIPATPSLAGTLLYAQYLVVDANGPFLGFSTLSDGLSMQIGS